MQKFSTSPREIAASVSRNRSLILAMVKREVVGRYRGSIMGLAWSFFSPLLMLMIYTFVFSVVFKARWGVGGEESRTDFAIILFVGMIVHGLFAECVNRAPALILSNVSAFIQFDQVPFAFIQSSGCREVDSKQRDYGHANVNHA